MRVGKEEAGAREGVDMRRNRLRVPTEATDPVVEVIHRHGGIELVKRIIDLVGWQWPLLLLPVVVIGLITILAYRTALPGRGKAVPLWPLIQVERSGTALNTILPFGNNSSHIVKIGLLRHWYSSEEIASAGVWCAAATGRQTRRCPAAGT